VIWSCLVEPSKLKTAQAFLTVSDQLKRLLSQNSNRQFHKTMRLYPAPPKGWLPAFSFQIKIKKTVLLTR